MTIGKLRSLLYEAAKVLGDVQAVRRGPRAISQRLTRRATGKMGGELLGTLWRRGGLLVLVCLLTGCGLTFPRLSKDPPKPTVTFALPAAWGCAHRTQTLPTPKGTLEDCTVCQNIARTVQRVTINKEAHTVPPQGRVAVCGSSAFMPTE